MVRQSFVSAPDAGSRTVLPLGFGASDNIRASLGRLLVDGYAQSAAL